MGERERCAVCDFPLATDADWKAFAADECLDQDEQERAHFGALLCWHGWWSRHRGPAIDWRAGAGGRATCAVIVALCFGAVAVFLWLGEVKP